jgi:hypothetical protein
MKLGWPGMDGGWTWFEDEFEATCSPVTSGLLEAQMQLYAAGGAVVRVVTLPPRTALAVMEALVSVVLLKAHHADIGAEWIGRAHIAIPSPLAPIQVVVDRDAPEARATLLEDLHAARGQRVRLSR